MSDDGEDLYKVYQSYGNALRTWLVAYGIGGPVLMLTNDSVRARIAASGSSRSIALCFLIGVAVQVAITAANKTIMWAQYFSTIHPPALKMKRYRLAAWLAEQLWIDITLDCVSIGLFVVATYRAFSILTGAP